MLRLSFVSLLIAFSAVLLLIKTADPMSGFDSLSQSPASVAQPAKGEISERVVCASDSTQTYSLYLPSNYTPKQHWPILYAFDPGARGKLPVDHYKDAAEKYGWIVAGSNNSHNGPMQAAVDAWKAMWADTHERFAIDQQRIYTTGFSGGARVAVMLANLCGDCVAGVIGSGAGFPVGVVPASTMRFVFFGTVGIDDPNFAEVRTLDEALLKANLVHNVRVFTGRHEWAPSAIATEAVEWMEIQAMKAGKRRRDDSLIEALWQKYWAAYQALEAAHKPYEAYQVLAALIDSFKGIHDTSDAEKAAQQLRDSRAVKDAMREERQQISRQRDNERELYTLISASNGEEAFDSGVRLRAAVAGLQKSARAETDSGERRVARRVSEGLFIGLFEQGLNLLQAQKSYDQAARKFELAVTVSPDRSGAFFYLACAYALKGEKKKSLQALKSATEKGFSDVSAITDNKAFDTVRNEPQYLEIMQKLKSAH